MRRVHHLEKSTAILNFNFEAPGNLTELRENNSAVRRKATNEFRARAIEYLTFGCPINGPPAYVGVCLRSAVSKISHDRKMDTCTNEMCDT
jgi:hypothetical protein